MYAQCYDGAEEKQGDATSCKSSEVWQKYAQVFCEGHCYKDNSKCGVNSFAVSGECYLGEGLCKEGESTNGCCERCGTKVEQKKKKQWFFKITEFADQLLNDLDDLDWPKGTKELQRNWIGKSIGADMKSLSDKW